MTTPRISSPMPAPSADGVAPVRRTIRVRATVEHAFDVFTAGIDRWWRASWRALERDRELRLRHAEQPARKPTRVRPA
jgi:hypothetical protein